VVGAGEARARDAQAQGPVALQRGRGGGLLARGDEAFRELAVGEPEECPRLEEGAEIPERRVRVAGHCCVAPATGLDQLIPLITRRREGSYTFFCRPSVFPAAS